MKPQHFAVSIGILSTLFLSACGGDDNSSQNTATVKPGKVVYDSEAFSIQIPKEWQIIEKNSFTSNVPAETIVGFRNNIKSNIFTANVNIAKKILEGPVSVKDFAKSTLEISKNNLIGYQLLNEKDDKTKYFTEFEGKKSASEPIIHFRQFYTVNNGIGYTATAAYLPNEDESIVNMIREMSDSFILK